VAGSRVHPTVPVACLPALHPRLKPILERHLRYAEIGAGWPDALGKVLSSTELMKYLRPDGSLDRRKLHPVLRRELHYIPELEEILSWGFTGERGWMESHATYAPDWYVRRSREAWQAGNYKLLAFLMGLVTHVGEYLTGYKGLPLMFHGLPRDLAPVPEWVKRGGPFYEPHPYRTAKRFPLRRIPTAMNARIVAGRLSKLTWAGPATELYRRILHEHYFGLYPLEVAWIVEHSRRDSPGSFLRWREVAYRGLTDTCLLAAAVLNDVLRPEHELLRRHGDLLVVIRGDLWRRKTGPPALARRRLPRDRYRLLGPLIKAGLDYELASGDALPDPDGFRAVLVVEEVPQRNDAAFYRRLRRYVRGGGRVVVLGRPVYPGGRADLHEELISLPGVLKVRGGKSMVAALSRLLGAESFPLEAGRPTKEALRLAGELAELRRHRVFVPAASGRRRGEAGFVLADELAACRQGWELWDGTRRWVPPAETERPFMERGGVVRVTVPPRATSLLALPRGGLVASSTVLEVALSNPAGGGFLVDIFWRRGRGRVPVAHAYLGPRQSFTGCFHVGGSARQAGGLELTVKHALVDGLDDAQGVRIDRFSLFRP